PCNRDFATDGQIGTTPDPMIAAPGCPAKPTFSGRGTR
ncbi:MAG: hypothetical protein QOK49_4415, partial [Baekduia sp.]|nr:hypothetical protein [Baekduia sp.]